MVEEDTLKTTFMALFAYLIIRLFQLVFSARTVFFSHNKSTETVFRLIFSAKRTGPYVLVLLISSSGLSWLLAWKMLVLLIKGYESIFLWLAWCHHGSLHIWYCDETRYTDISFTACSVGWFVLLPVREEVLLTGLCERKILFRLEIYDRLRQATAKRIGW